MKKGALRSRGVPANMAMGPHGGCQEVWDTYRQQKPPVRGQSQGVSTPGEQ